MKMRFVELFIVITLFLALATILLPAFSRTRETSRRSSCQNNLMEFALVFKMYTNESKGEVYPGVSHIPCNWLPDIKQIYPEYVCDLNIFACPSNPFYYTQKELMWSNADGSSRPACVGSFSYLYTGYAIWRDEQAQALFSARSLLAPEDFGLWSIEISVPNEKQPIVPPVSEIPIMWDRLGLSEMDSNHVPAGSNVLYADGHVCFQQYSYYNGIEQFPVTYSMASTFGSSVPQLSQDCYK
ncbi:MAG TPA: hypothetical protein PLI09_21145 [Candidatus Hydrogenedentes bacterium]|nr:hypothetical protein [Candidatus Hydrogenedentota bacterium]